MLDPKMETLLMVCERGSFTRAAEALSLTQPAVSHHIRQLEMEKGKLVEQLVDYHEIKRENERLKEQLRRKDRRETK